MAAVYKALSKSAGGPKPTEDGAGVRKNKQRVLILSSRGTTHRHRHLLNDLAAMLPHGRKDAKFDNKSNLYQLNELAELYNCNNVLFFEARKGKDLYVWISKVGNGPTVKMHLQNLHTMDELHFTGNCLKGSRPILSFDAAFDKHAHLRLLRELFIHVFGVPQGARKAKPFVDHVLTFSIVDGKIWVRNYQISEVEAAAVATAAAAAAAAVTNGVGGDAAANKPKAAAAAAAAAAGIGSREKTDLSLVEVGPRFVLQPILIQEGSFGGPIIYENREFVSPNQVRADVRRKQAVSHRVREDKQIGRRLKKDELGLASGRADKAHQDELDVRALFT